MSFSRALRLGAPALAALLVPACSNNNNTITDVPRAAITVTVDPNPVPPSQNVLTGSVSIGYKITITETAGLGGDDAVREQPGVRPGDGSAR